MCLFWVGDNMSIFNKILENNKNSNIIIGLNNELKGLFIYNKFKEINDSLIVVLSSLYEANMMYQTISNYTTDVVFFPMDDFLTSEALAVSPELKFTRLETLNSIINSKKIVVTNLMGYLRYLPPKKLYLENVINLKVNNDYNFKKLIEKLLKMGYVRETIVNKTGEMAVRGFVIDLFILNKNNPIRIEFWGDTIESIREFNVDTQLTINNIDSISVIPVSESLLEEDINFKHRDVLNYYKPDSINDYIENNNVYFIDFNSICTSYELLVNEMFEYKISNELDKDIKFMFEFDTNLNDEYYYLMNFDNNLNINESINYSVYDIENFKGTINDINNRLNIYIKDNYTVIICIGNKYKINKIIESLNNSNLIFTDENNIYDNKINILNKNINSGFIINKYVVICEKELFNKKEVNSLYKSNFKVGTKIRDINKLEVGDYIVHSLHGIGRYIGIKTLTKNGFEKDYIQLEYKNNDKLYIPVEKLELITKYNSSDGLEPKLNKLGGVEWTKTKLRVKNKIESIAGDLLKLYAEREQIQGFAFNKDDENQIEFEKQFKFEETVDQLRVIDEIKKDMESSHPMDRLLCGDVGYGKTEVAFRAAFKAIMSGKQVALLCPTTILSTQHFNNSLERFSCFDANIEVLNRFVTTKKQKDIIQRLKEGKVDFLIGTHRILSEDIEFKNLGLLIIDEEQRFGVKHKEKIKQYKNNIDVLTLSATPIPRTLQMSMAGIRSLSLIETPPVDRYPVQTYVLEENNQIIKDAIYKELSREGQIFLLYNSIENMEAKALEISRLVPEAKIVCAHGRMNKTELETIMTDFQNGLYDILLCTTIIETGIDIPSVNTLIIIDADCFGLAQLYQIRGRVGRSNKIAYCYLMYKKGRILSEISTKRLNVIKEFTELGSGFSIAMRDLSIRGAGDILGSEQAGFVDAIGIDLFIKMLNDEVNKLKGNNINDEELNDSQPLVEVSTTISDEYVSEETLKIEIHQKICNIDSIEMLENIKIELEDRFGKLSDEIIIYMYEILFEHLASKLNINKVIQTKNFISLYLPVSLSNNIDGDKLFMDLCSLTRKIRFGMKNKELIITLETINLDKHYIYYLIDIVDSIKNNLKKEEI